VTDRDASACHDSQQSRDAAAPDDAPERSSESLSMLTFRAGSAWFGVSAKTVEEVCDACEPTPIPGSPSYLPGLMNLRGSAVPLLDLVRYLSLDASQPERERGEVRGRIVVVSTDSMRVGLTCDQVRGVIDFEKEDLCPAGAALGGKLESYSRAEVHQPDGVLSILDLSALLKDSRIQ
jgi:purine-binding chemotaxis protein CheW